MPNHGLQPTAAACAHAPLRGDRAGKYSIRVNDQWRICFRWRDGDAHNVEITDYHRGWTDC